MQTHIYIQTAQLWTLPLYMWPVQKQVFSFQFCPQQQTCPCDGACVWKRTIRIWRTVQSAELGFYVFSINCRRSVAMLIESSLWRNIEYFWCSIHEQLRELISSGILLIDLRTQLQAFLKSFILTHTHAHTHTHTHIYTHIQIYSSAVIVQTSVSSCSWRAIWGWLYETIFFHWQIFSAAAFFTLSYNQIYLCRSY